jgi:hypothetical protein
MDISAPQRLPDELIALIFDYLAPNPQTVCEDSRRFLSVESFGPPPEILPSTVQHIGAFRLASKKFADIGAPLLFGRVQARLSKPGLQRLETLSKWQVASHVKKFSYMVPYFYGNNDATSDDTQSLLLELEAQFGHPNASSFQEMKIKFQKKILEQRRITSTGYDADVLNLAVASFTSLQHVQLMRIHDDEDNVLISYLRQRDPARAVAIIRQKWTEACIHGSRTIGAALLASNVPCEKFSSPQLSPQSARFLLQNKPNSFATLAGRLTCLTLHFDDGEDLDVKMRELSGLFRSVFAAATEMKAVHVGFPSHRPLSLPLEDVFHNVTWNKLVAFGIQGWKLTGDEVIDLALRHQERLKGLRLRDIVLREGSYWKDVLGELRDSMVKLNWVSLRRIGYERDFDDRLSEEGAEVPDDHDLDLESESENSDEDYEAFAGPSSSQHFTAHSNDDDFRDHDTASDSAFDSDAEHGGDAYNMDFPPLDSPVTPASATWCNCNTRSWADSRESLGDDGVSVSNSQRKAWEKWVIRRCPEHSEP